MQGIDIVTACQEIVALASPSLRADNAIKSQVAKSLLADFKIAASASKLGPRSRENLQVSISRILKSLNHSGDLRNAGPPATALLTDLSVDPATGLAWDDLVSVSGSEGKHERRLGIRDTFIAIAGLNHHELESFSRADAARGILRNSAFYVAEASHLLGLPVTTMPEPHEDAALSQGERLTLCRQLWQNPNETVDCIVWLSYEFATMATPTVNKGRIAFYNVEDLRRTVDGNGQAIQLPNEVRNRLDDFRAWLPPAEGGQVVVRVEVTSPVAAAVGAAVRDAESLLQFAGRTRRAGWKRVPNRVFHVINGRRAQWNRLRPGAVSEPADWRQSPVAMLLAESEPMPKATDELKEALAALGALANDTGDAPQRRVVARVELIERAKLVISDVHWVDLTKRLRSIWVAQSLLDNLISAAVWVHQRIGDKIDGVDVAGDRASRIADSFISEASTGRYIHNDKIVELSAELCSLLPCGWSPREELVHARRILTDVDRKRTEVESGLEFDLLLQRALRCRNAASHGWPVKKRSAESVVPFLTFVADTLTDVQLQAERRGIDPAARLNDVIAEVETKFRRILDGDFDHSPNTGT